jgi:uncharacterized protein YndB with AHSA1/START domain
MDEVALRINAPAETVYDLVADVTQMGRWSPECTGGRWIDGASGPAVGARFKGSNRKGMIRWTRTCEVTKAERGRAFEWVVRDSGVRWEYRFEPDGDTTTVTEYREITRQLPLRVRIILATGLLGRDRDAAIVEGMKATLDRLKDAAEG